MGKFDTVGKQKMVDNFVRRKSFLSEWGRENATFSEYLNERKGRDLH